MGVREWADRLAGVAPERRAEPPQLFDLVTGAWSGVNRTGTVTYQSAQAHGAVYACVGLLVRLVVWQMPVKVVGSSDPPRPVARPPQVVMNPHPEPQMLAEHWRAAALEAAALRGFAAGIVTSREPSGWPRQVMPLHPDSVTWYTDPRSGVLEWRADGREVGLWQNGGELWVAPSMEVTPGWPVGKSVLAHAAQIIKLGLSARTFGANFFDAGGLPAAHGRVLDRPNVTEQQATQLKARIQETTRRREPLVTGSNFELTTIPINAEESQFLETMQANVADVARFFGIPPEMVGGTSGDSMTYANVEGRNLGLLTNTVGAWMNWFELTMSSMIPRPQLVELDPKALLRTSVTANIDNAQKLVGRGNTPGISTRDEARELAGLPPLGGDDGEAIYVPVNYGPTGVLEEVLVGEDGQQAPAA